MASHQSMTGQKSTLTKSNFLQPIIHIVNLMVWSDNVSLFYEIYILQVRIHSLSTFKSFWQDILSKTLPENKSFPSSALTTVLGYSTGTIGKIMFDKCLMFYCLIISPPHPPPKKLMSHVNALRYCMLYTWSKRNALKLTYFKYTYSVLMLFLAHLLKLVALSVLFNYVYKNTRKAMPLM